MAYIIDGSNSNFVTIDSAFTFNVSNTINVTTNGFAINNGGFAAISLEGMNQTYTVNVAGTVTAWGSDTTGIYVSASDKATINVGITGNVRGGDAAIFAGGLATIVNYGLISNDSNTLGAIHETGNGNYTITNHGVISNENGYAIRMTGSGTHTIINTGTIDTGGAGLPISSSHATAVTIIKNSGTIDGYYTVLGEGADTVTNTASGRIVLPVYLGGGADKYTGGLFTDTVYAGVGADTLIGGGGVDRLGGGENADVITGGAGKDTLFGNNDNSVVNDAALDRFVYNAVSESGPTAATRDVIADFFQASDKIDLRLIDANTKIAGNQLFTWQTANGAAFTGVAGQLHSAWINPTGTANDRTIISGDINGDKIADFSIELIGLKALTAIDFML